MFNYFSIYYLADGLLVDHPLPNVLRIKLSISSYVLILYFFAFIFEIIKLTIQATIPAGTHPTKRKGNTGNQRFSGLMIYKYNQMKDKIYGTKKDIIIIPTPFE